MRERASAAARRFCSRSPRLDPMPMKTFSLTSDSRTIDGDGRFPAPRAHAENVLHVVEARSLPHRETGGAKGSNDETFPARRSVGDFQALPIPEEIDGVVSHHV